HQRIAYSFIAGDMFTIVLADSGKIHWDWGTPWETPKPDQKSITTLIRNLNAWRKGAGRPFVCFGRMVKPYVIEGARDIPMVLKINGRHRFPSLLTSRWLSPQGREAQIVVNYTTEKQDFRITGLNPKQNMVSIYEEPDDDRTKTVPVKGGKIALSISPLSAIMVEFGD
ncbi:MAG: hypothetical protein JSV03_14230, partial [Planctomycetota bacterium]